jgi:hypothetical protein
MINDLTSGTPISTNKTFEKLPHTEMLKAFFNDEKTKTCLMLEYFHDIHTAHRKIANVSLAQQSKSQVLGT